MSSRGVKDVCDIILDGSKDISSNTLMRLLISFAILVGARGHVDIDIGTVRVVFFPNPKSDFTGNALARSVKTRMINMSSICEKNKQKKLIGLTGEYEFSEHL